MNFDYTAEQRALKDQARRVLAELGATAATRRALDGDAGAARTLWQRLAKLRWQALAIPERYGGDGLGPVAQCALAEELGRALAPLPFSSSLFVAAEALQLAGTEAQKLCWLPKLASGEVIGTFGFAEGLGALRESTIRMRCVGGRISGIKLVPDGDMAALAVVVARVGESSVGLYLVELDAAGVRREPLASLDPSRPWSRVHFDGASVEPLAGTTPLGSAFQRLLERAAIFLAFEQLGGADRCLDLAREYALQREAFGRVIGQYQAVKHRLADMYVANELARSNAYYAAWALETDSIEQSIAAAVARIAATDAFERAARDYTQTLGGISATWAHDAHLYYRRSRHLATLLGAAADWRDRLAGHVDRLTAS